MRVKEYGVLKSILFIFLLGVFTLSNSFAGEKTKDIIQKAQNLTQQRDRILATNILIEAIQKESPTSSSYHELMEALEAVSQTFYTDKVQQLYEFALTIKKTNPTSAIDNLTEALRLEENNLKLLLALGRIYIGNNDCSKSEKIIEEAKKIHPYSKELSVLTAQMLICLNKFDEYWILRGGVKEKDRDRSWILLDAQYYFQAKKIKKAIAAASKLYNENKKFPESYYWLWKTESVDLNKKRKHAHDYVLACKSLSIREERALTKEPLLCKAKQELEVYLQAETQKNGNEEAK